MTNAITQSQAPEDREYARYLDEIEARKRRVAELQTDLELLNEELGHFNAEYHLRVGALFVELDKLDLAIAEYEFRITRLNAAPNFNPDEVEQETHTLFSEQREEVHQDEEETKRHQRAFNEARRRPVLGEASAAKLKSLYRELVKRFHPDLARTELERQKREAVMKRINAAFHDRDVGTLQSIMTETEFEDASFESRSVGEKLVWAIREVSRLDSLIADITSEIEILRASDLASLWGRHQTGEGVLEQLERDLNRRIETRQQALQGLISEFLAQVAQVNHG